MASDVVGLVLDYFVELRQVLVQISHPVALLLHDVLSCTRVSHLPLVDELANVTHFSGD